MESEISVELINRIKKEAKGSVYEFIIVTAFFLFVGVTIFFNKPGLSRTLIALFEFSFYCYYMYLNTIRKNKIINRTITEIFSDEEYFTFSTSDAYFFHIIYKPALSIKVAHGDLVLELTNYPINKMFGYSGKVYKLADEGKDYYFMSDFFNPDLENKLMISS